MSYHVEEDHFDELPEEIVVHEDGYYGAWKEDGEPIVDYVYKLEGHGPEHVKLNGPVNIMFEDDLKMIAELKQLVADAVSVALGWAWLFNQLGGHDPDDYTTLPGKTAAELYARAEKLGCTGEDM